MSYGRSIRDIPLVVVDKDQKMEIRGTENMFSYGRVITLNNWASNDSITYMILDNSHPPFDSQHVVVSAKGPFLTWQLELWSYGMKSF